MTCVSIASWSPQTLMLFRIEFLLVHIRISFFVLEIKGHEWRGWLTTLGIIDLFVVPVHPSDGPEPLKERDLRGEASFVIEVFGEDLVSCDGKCARKVFFLHEFKCQCI